MWERRYGFPKPGRDENGERQYTAADIAQAAGDQAADGRRACVPARSSRCSQRGAQRAGRRAHRAAQRRELAPALERDVLAMLQDPRRHRRCSRRCANLLMRQGLQQFVLETLTPLNRAVGDAWMRGELAGVRGASVHRTAAGRAAHRDQRVPAADRHAARAADDVPERAARPRPADGRGDAGARRRCNAFRLGRRRRSRTSGARRSRTRCTSSRCRSPAAFPVRQASDGLAALRRAAAAARSRCGRAAR